MAASVTVVIPVWDEYVRFLPEAVTSVRADDPETPILVIDNASAEPVVALDGTRVVRAPRRLTVGAARNLGIDEVDTPFVLILDADDLLLPGALQFLVSRISADPEASLCATSIVEGDTGERHRTPRPFVFRLARWPRLFACAHSVWSLVPIQGCAIFRTAEVRDAGGYADADWGDDWVLAVSMAFRGRVEVSERLGRYYRATADSVSRRPRSAEELSASARLVRERIRSDRGVPGWARAALPLIAIAQLAAVRVIRPAYRFATRSGRG
jgi:glycosyltransferase involved in cell wall biosynthesis